MHGLNRLDIKTRIDTLRLMVRTPDAAWRGGREIRWEQTEIQ